MKKTLTAALALTAFAGIAFADAEREKATINSQFAGCFEIEVSSSMFVINPFTPFEGATLTLGDIDGSAATNGFIRVYDEKGKKAFDAEWAPSEEPAGWYTLNDNGGYVAFTNAHPLARGTSVQFVKGTLTETLSVAGVLSLEDKTVTCVRGQNFVGSVAPVQKNLTDFAVGGSFDPWSDYVAIGSSGTKYVYDGGNWYLRSDYLGTAATITPVTDVTIKAGEGFRVYTPSGAGATVSLPAL